MKRETANFQLSEKNKKRIKPLRRQRGAVTELCNLALDHFCEGEKFELFLKRNKRA